MKTISIILGNFHQDKEWTRRLSGAAIEWLTLDHVLFEQNRIEVRTSGGKEMLVVLEGNSTLKDGDILAWEEEEDRAVVVRISSRKTYVSKYDNPQKLIGCVSDFRS